MLLEKLPKTSRSSKTMLSGLVVMLVAFFTFDWIVSPQLTYLHAAERYIGMIDYTGQKLELVKQRVKSKEIQLEKLSGEIESRKRLFFNPQSAREFLSDLEPLALQCKCVIVSQAAVPADAAAGAGSEKTLSVKTETVALNIKGQFEDLLKFFQKLRSYPQKIYLRELIMESRGLQSGHLVCYVTLTIHVLQDKEIVPHE